MCGRKEAKNGRPPRLPSGQREIVIEGGEDVQEKGGKRKARERGEKVVLEFRCPKLTAHPSKAWYIFLSMSRREMKSGFIF